MAFDLFYQNKINDTILSYYPLGKYPDFKPLTYQQELVVLYRRNFGAKTTKVIFLFVCICFHKNIKTELASLSGPSCSKLMKGTEEIKCPAAL